MKSLRRIIFAKFDAEFADIGYKRFVYENNLKYGEGVVMARAVRNPEVERKRKQVEEREYHFQLFPNSTGFVYLVAQQEGHQVWIHPSVGNIFHPLEEVYAELKDEPFVPSSRFATCCRHLADVLPNSFWKIYPHWVLPQNLKAWYMYDSDSPERIDAIVQTIVQGVREYGIAYASRCSDLSGICDELNDLPTADNTKDRQFREPIALLMAGRPAEAVASVKLHCKRAQINFSQKTGSTYGTDFTDFVKRLFSKYSVQVGSDL